MRKVWFHGEVDHDNVSRLLEQLLDFNDSEDVVNLFIDSWGGDATYALSYYEIVQSLRFPIRAIAIHECDSAAMDLFILSGAERVVLPSTTFLMHAPKYANETPHSLSHVQDALVRFAAYNEQIEALEHKAISADKLEAWDRACVDCRDREIHFTAKEAYDWGIATCLATTETLRSILTS